MKSKPNIFLQDSEVIDVDIEIAQIQKLIVKNFFTIERKYGKVDLTLFLSQGKSRKFSYARVVQIFGSFESALHYYTSQTRLCLKCNKKVLKPNWLCTTCRISNQSIADVYGDGAIR